MHPIVIPEGLKARARYRFDDLVPSATALLVIDMQNIFTEPVSFAASPHAREIIPTINRIAARLRSAGGTVIYTRHTIVTEGPRALAEWQRRRPTIVKMAELLQPGGHAHALDSAVDVERQDIVVDKYRESALTHNSSDLNEILAAKAIDTVIIVGVVANCCCECTARDASMLGYKTFFVADATAALCDEDYNAALVSVGSLFGDLRGSDEIMALIGG